jgi:hypothetical protein
VTLEVLSVVDRRGALRFHQGELPVDLRGRVRPGQSVRVINLSPRGALLESSRRLLPGSRIDVHLECCHFQHVTRATVIRCYVGVLLPHAVLFRAAIEFDRRLERWQVVPDPVPLGQQGHQPAGHGWTTVQTGQ